MNHMYRLTIMKKRITSINNKPLRVQTDHVLGGESLAIQDISVMLLVEDIPLMLYIACRLSPYIVQQESSSLLDIQLSLKYLNADISSHS